MTWIDVASDAVKIGLGAAVGGLFALLGVFLNHRHKLSEELVTRRRNTIDGIADTFEKIDCIAVARLTTFSCYHVAKDIKSSELRTETKLIESMLDRTSSVKALEDLHTIECRATLIGCPLMADAIGAYRNLFLDVEVPNIIDTKTKIKDLGDYIDLSEKMKLQRKKVLAAIGDAYTKQ